MPRDDSGRSKALDDLVESMKEQSINGWSILTTAIIKKADPDLIIKLIENDTYETVGNNKDSMYSIHTLSSAVEQYPNNIDLIKVLLKKTNCEICNGTNKNTLDSAINYEVSSEVMDYLLMKGADPESLSNSWDQEKQYLIGRRKELLNKKKGRPQDS